MVKPSQMNCCWSTQKFLEGSTIRITDRTLRNLLFGTFREISGETQGIIPSYKNFLMNSCRAPRVQSMELLQALPEKLLREFRVKRLQAISKEPVEINGRPFIKIPYWTSMAMQFCSELLKEFSVIQLEEFLIELQWISR